MSAERPEVLFLCVHNAGRSQMAAALLERRAGDRVLVHSAGSAPGETLNPAVVAAMAEWAIDITDRVPQALTEAMARSADVIISMGCGYSCPVYPGKRYVDWELPDPHGRTLAGVRPIRDEIDARVGALVDSLVGGSAPAGSDGGPRSSGP